MPADPKRVQEVFLAAVDRPSPADRAAYLEAACGADAELRGRVEALLRAHDRPSESPGDPRTAPFALPDPDATTLPPPPPGTAAYAGPAEGVGAVVGGRYKLLEALGEGGMGSVFMAQQTEPVRRMVAVKLIKPGMDSKQVVARFGAERQALALMDHPNIAKVLDAGTTDSGRPYFVMELVKGVPITAFCDERHLNPRERLELFVPVCQAVQHAHQKGVIHRDIKPSNVLVALYDGRPVPKVIDFGVAKAAGSPLTDKTLFTGFGAVVGTPEYMSPEQAEINQLDIDTRSDVYALGVLLYELLTGSPPIDRRRLGKAGLLEILRVIREEDPPRPSTRLSTSDALPTIAANRRTDPAKLTRLVRGELDWVVMKALEKDRTRRYDTAAGLALDVQRYLADEPVAAGPPSGWYRARKFVRRNRAGVLAALAVVVALVGGIVGTAAGLVEARRQRDVAEAARRDEQQQREAAVAERDAKEKARQAEAEQRAAAVAERDEKEKARRAEARQRAAAVAARERAEGLRLAAEASAAARTDPGLAVLLAAEGARRFPHHLTFAALYEAAAERREERTVTGDGRSVRLARYSPDGRLVLVARDVDGFTRKRGDIPAVVIHDAETGERVAAWVGYGLNVGAADWSPDGKRIAVALQGYRPVRFTDGKPPPVALFTDRMVYVFDAATGRDVLHVGRHAERVADVRFSPDGSRLVTAGWDGTARVWDAASGKLVHTLTGHTQALLSAAFSPDGRHILTLTSAAGRQSASEGDWSGRPEGAKPPVDPGPTDRPGDFLDRPTGEGASTLGGDAVLARVWDAGTGRPVATLKKNRPALVFGRRWTPTAGGFSPDGTRVVIAFTDDVAAVWDAAEGGPEKVLLEGHAGAVRAAAFDPTGKMIATAADDRTARLWDAESGKELARLRGHRGAVTGVRFDPAGKRVLTWSADGTGRVWDAATGEEVAHLRGHRGEVRDAGFSPDGRRVLTAGDTTARVWSLAPPPELARVIRAHAAPLTALAFRPDGGALLTAAEDETARLFDPGTGRELAALGAGRVLGAVRWAAFRPDGAAVVTASETTRGYKGRELVNRSAVHVWDPATGADRVQLAEHDFGASFAAFAPDGGRLVTVGDGARRSRGGVVSGSQSSSEFAGLVRVWDARTGRLLFTPPPRARAGSRPEFSRDGKYLLVEGANGSAFLFDGGTGNQLRTLPPDMSGWVGVAALSPDGKRVLTAGGSSAGPVLWDPETGAAIAKLPRPREPVTAATFSPDGKRLVTLAGRTASVWEAATGAAVATLAGHEAAVVAADFAADGAKLVTGSADRTAAVWDVTSGRLEAVYVGHPGPVKFVAFAPSGRAVATGSSDGTVRVWPLDPVRAALASAPRGLTAAERERYELPERPGD